MVYRETDADLILDSLNILVQARVLLLERFHIDREERSEVRRRSQGRPPHQLSKELRRLLTSTDERFRQISAHLNLTEAYIGMMEGRLDALGVTAHVISGERFTSR